MAKTTKKTQGKGKALAVQKKKSQDVYDYGDQAGIGSEDITQDDFLVPFVRILQTNSPQLQSRNEKFIKDAKAGMFFNTVSGKLYDGEKGFAFHMAFKMRAYAEFTPRDEGGGFVGQRDPDDPLVEKLRQAQGRFGKLTTDQNTELVETYYAYGLVIDSDDEVEPEPVVLPLSSTGITPFKQFLGTLNPILRRGAPIFAPRVRVSARFTTNKEGEFFRWHFALDGSDLKAYLLKPNDPIMAIAAEFRASVTTGATRVDYTASRDDAADTDAF